MTFTEHLEMKNAYLSELQGETDEEKRAELKDKIFELDQHYYTQDAVKECPF